MGFEPTEVLPSTVFKTVRLNQALSPLHIQEHHFLCSSNLSKDTPTSKPSVSRGEIAFYLAKQRDLTRNAVVFNGKLTIANVI